MTAQTPAEAIFAEKNLLQMQICSPSAVYLVHLRSSAVSLQDVRASSACREFFAPTQACPSLVRITTLRTHRSANRYLTSSRGKLARMHSSYSPRSSLQRALQSKEWDAGWTQWHRVTEWTRWTSSDRWRKSSQNN